ncbi:Ku protein [Geodermatophilus sp. SYSU D00697]
MRSIWRGAVSFGLVSIGVKLYTATEDHDIRFNQVHATDGGRIKYKRVCSIDGEEVEYSEIAKGYELPDGQLVILTDEDFEELPLASRREIEVLEFVDQDDIDPIHFEKTYFLEPDASATRPYVLLRDALENAGQVAITKIAIRQRESLAALRVRDGVMVLHTMRWPDEIRRPDFAFLDEDIAVRPQELQMAEALISSMTGEFDPAQFTDDYREAMAALLEAKQSGGEVQPLPETADPGAAVVDLMSALRRSVEQARGGAAQEEPPARRAPAKKATAAKRATRPAADEEPEERPARKATTRKTAAAKATAAEKTTAAEKATAAEKTAAAEKTPARKTAAAAKARADEQPAKRARRTA